MTGFIKILLKPQNDNGLKKNCRHFTTNKAFSDVGTRTVV